MRKSKKDLDLNIKEELTRSFAAELVSALESTKRGADWEVTQFACQYLVDNLLTKYVDRNTDPPQVRRDRAIVKWLAVEERNARTSERIWHSETSFTGVGTSTSILLRASDHIRRILGEAPPDDIIVEGSFSGGATTSKRRGVGMIARKLEGGIHVTKEAKPAFLAAVRQLEGWASLSPSVLQPEEYPGNVLFTVPKTAVIDRVACKEPDGNVFGQKAIGDFIRRRLKTRARIDLNDQSVNRSLAERGSRHGDLATIDLSSASDSLSDGLVGYLLPPLWLKLLDSFRCHTTLIDGVSHKNEMFSSMGNGFTFELESLVFWALAKATCYLSGTRGRVSVYGDDIIVPTAIARSFCQVLNWCGFKTNASKTFVEGPFRESCGGHYYGGCDVTPFYLRKPWTTVSDVVLSLNQLRAWIIRVNADYLPNSPVVRVWRKYAKLVPVSLTGGWDLSSRTQLASPGVPRCELQMVKKRFRKVEESLQLGLYLASLRLDFIPNVDLLTQDRLTEFTKLEDNTSSWRIRRVKTKPSVFGLVCPLFHQEQFVYEDGTPPVGGTTCEGGELT